MHFLAIIQFYGSISVKILVWFSGKGYSTQYCLLAMLKKWKSAVDKGKLFSAY